MKLFLFIFNKNVLGRGKSSRRSFGGKGRAQRRAKIRRERGGEGGGAERRVRSSSFGIDSERGFEDKLIIDWFWQCFPWINIRRDHYHTQ